MSILVAGGGIGGPAFAYWASRAGFKVTIVERAPSIRTSGQNVDVRGSALWTLKQMGVYKAIEKATTGEEGLYFVDEQNRKRAAFPVDRSGKGLSFTAEVEILRGAMSNVLYEATRESCMWIFGDYISSVEQNGDGVRVGFAKGRQSERYDLLVAADGLYSKTRSLINPAWEESCIRSLDVLTSWFSIPIDKNDGTWARGYNAPKGRSVLLRPDKSGVCRASLTTRTTGAFRDAQKLSNQELKELFRDQFADVRWVEIGRVLDGMMTADDFYVQDVAQIKLDSWSRGRCVLLGDAGYCPSPITGLGTSSAVPGAYILAGELLQARNPTDDSVDYQKALNEYERKFRPFMQETQKLPPGAPNIALPLTSYGVMTFRIVVAIVARIVPYIIPFLSGSTRDYKLDPYAWPSLPE
ncbi:uncharacterized protein L969DRAFT_51813 [Mixia osmundae IAM 14324]|uniref:FAD-binding domain-containing protein n=1 Tax=Mixia osmundae (strain CBS 9802 / IAM 14324 / JCM 22182 / KY 12970) TaxID=764103 RepID=G7DX26_MIXOS|nr:uncharacterized protein L969DRAFT_51813 [Mixia osmundae IAM 14324]KEI38068.1 hypothetical protein L969DRAFT_51813 [Mixia osmundae IAM 14324]GAA95123.1 hypothetical protein E5Q_01778 [Mixia osmundae IAM 14324]